MTRGKGGPGVLLQDSSDYTSNRLGLVAQSQVLAGRGWTLGLPSLDTALCDSAGLRAR
jgi:hypothetical protein